MSTNFGRVGHEENPQERLFDCYVRDVIRQLRLLPHRGARKKAFDAITKKRSDKDKIEKAVKEMWNQ